MDSERPSISRVLAFCNSRSCYGIQRFWRTSIGSVQECCRTHRIPPRAVPAGPDRARRWQTWHLELKWPCEEPAREAWPCRRISNHKENPCPNVLSHLGIPQPLESLGELRDCIRDGCTGAWSAEFELVSLCDTPKARKPPSNWIAHGTTKLRAMNCHGQHLGSAFHPLSRFH
jgi:hypothetical protein